MRNLFIFPVLLFCVPLLASAQSLQTFLTTFVVFLNTVIIPFLFGAAFLFFAINVVRYFVLGSTSEDGREKAKYLAIYSILAFVILIVFWGVINLLVDSTDLGGWNQPTPDYIEQRNGPGGPLMDDPCDVNPNSPFCIGSGGAV